MVHLTGAVLTYRLCGHTRRYSLVTLPYRDARRAFAPRFFRAIEGRGEQRDPTRAHYAAIRRAMQSGEFTPTPWSAGLLAEHAERLVLEGDAFRLEVPEGAPLPLVDGNHRNEALSALEALLTRTAEDVKALASSVKEAEDFLEQLDDLAVTVVVYLDGSTQADFLNLQKGRPVDAAHRLVLATQQEALLDPCHATALDVAKLLHKKPSSPFHNLIRFDSMSRLPLPYSTLCARGPSDQSTSLLGTARYARTAWGQAAAGRAANAFLCAHEALREGAPGLFAAGRALTPVSEGGTKGAATLTVGLGLLHMARCQLLGRRFEDAELLGGLVAAAAENLCLPRPSFVSSQKRSFMSTTVKALFADDDLEKHEGVPVALVRATSPSAYLLGPMKKGARCA